MNLVVRDSGFYSSSVDVVKYGAILDLDASTEGPSSVKWHDKSGRGNDFSKTGSVVWQPENGGRFFLNGGSFDFINPLTSINNGNGIFNLQDFSIEFWHYPIPYGNYSTPCLWSYDWSSHRNPHYVQHFRLSYDNIKTILSSTLSGPNPNKARWNRGSNPEGLALIHNAWNYHVWSRSYTKRKEMLFYNGNMVSSKDDVAVISNYTNQEVWIGRGNYGGTSLSYWSFAYKGYLSIVRFHRRALSLLEVKNNFNAEKQRFGL